MLSDAIDVGGSAMNVQNLIWLLIALTGAVDYALLKSLGMSVVVEPGAAILFLALLCLTALFDRYLPSVSRLTRAFAQLMAFAEVGGWLTYAAMAASPFPLADKMLSHADAALGFDWVAWYDWVQAHPLFEQVLSIAYGSIPYQLVALLFCACYADTKRVDELIIAAILSGAAVSIGMVFFPAIGAWTQHGIGRIEPWRQDILALRDHAILTVDHTQGIVTFPSFHTVCAVLLANTVRGRKLFIPILLVNVAMIVSVMSEGAHYGVDMLGGLVVAWLSIVASRWLIGNCESWDLGWQTQPAEQLLGLAATCRQWVRPSPRTALIKPSANRRKIMRGETVL